MLNNDDLLKVIFEETVAKVVNSLPLEKKEVIIRNAVIDIIKRQNLGWEFKKVIEKEAVEIAENYVKTQEVQQMIKEKVIRETETVIGELAGAIGSTTRTVIKSKYNDWKER